MLRASCRLESVEREMEAKTREMSEMASPRYAEMSAELDGLRQARDQLKVECTKLQSRINDDLPDDESRRYALHCIYIIVLI